MLDNVLQKRGKFPLLIALLLDPSGCGVNRAWLHRDVRKGTLSHVSCVKMNTEQSATMSGDSSDSGDLSLSCSVSSVEIEELEVLEVERYLETVEPYQFESLAIVIHQQWRYR